MERNGAFGTVGADRVGGEGHDRLASGASGSTSEPTAPSGVAQPHTPEAWLALAAERPEWMLWGKGQPKSGWPAHPLLCHMVDVAAVASRLLTDVVPPALGGRLLAIHADPAEARSALLHLIALHDLGKASPAFQGKIAWAATTLPDKGFDRLDAPPGVRHHGEIGLLFVYSALTTRGAPGRIALRLARAVTAHHGEFPSDARGLKTPGSRERGRGTAWEAARSGIESALADLFGVGTLRALREPDHAFIVLLAGLTSVADWIGSMEESFQYEPPQRTLGEYWLVALQRADEALARVGMRPSPPDVARAFCDLFPDKSPWPLHSAAETLAAKLSAPALIVIEAPMGEGKTEAALVLATSAAARVGQHGLFVGLPTRATANAMLPRIESFLGSLRPTEPANLLLTHSDARLVQRFQHLIKLGGIGQDGAEQGGAGRSESVRAEEWFLLSKKRALLSEYAVGTVDQALLSVMRVPHGFVRLFGLAGKVVILDEVHAYDTYTSTLLERLVEWLGATGSTVVVLSATLPAARRTALLRAYQAGAHLLGGELATNASYPRITVTSGAGTAVRSVAARGESLRVIMETASENLEQLARIVVDEARKGCCVGWICNTVARVQRAAVAVRELAPDIGQRLLVHARLLPEERDRREAQLLRWLGPQSEAVARPERCIVIGTQVLEQSLDVDFDLLVTDLAPVDLILQRAGRLWRHDRSNRSRSVPEARLVLARPDGPWETVPLGTVAPVYAELLVRRTLRRLEGLKTIALPDDIEGLVQPVYSDETVPEDSHLFGAYLDHQGTSAARRNLADQKLMPRPSVSDDPFADFEVFLTEDDPVLHQQLRADTRLGPPSVDVVCLERRDGKLLVGDDDATEVDLSVTPSPDLVLRLVRRSIGVGCRRLFRALTNDQQYAAPGWRQSAALRHRRVVAFTDRRAQVGEHTLTLDPELGLCIDTPGGDLGD